MPLNTRIRARAHTHNPAYPPPEPHTHITHHHVPQLASLLTRKDGEGTSILEDLAENPLELASAIAEIIGEEEEQVVAREAGEGGTARAVAERMVKVRAYGRVCACGHV